MNMKIPLLLKPDLRAQRRKTGLMLDKGHMRKQEKTVAHSVLPSDMPRIEKPLVSEHSITHQSLSFLSIRRKSGALENGVNVGVSNFSL